jgi:hypothetical protein
MKRILAIILVAILLLLLGYITIIKFVPDEDKNNENTTKDVVTNYVCTKTSQRNKNVSETYTLIVDFNKDIITAESLEIKYTYIDGTSKTSDKSYIDNINTENTSIDNKYEGIIYIVSIKNDLEFVHVLEFDNLNLKSFYNSKDYDKYSNLVLKTKNEFLDKIKRTEYTCKEEKIESPIIEEV